MDIDKKEDIKSSEKQIESGFKNIEEEASRGARVYKSPEAYQEQEKVTRAEIDAEIEKMKKIPELEKEALQAAVEIATMGIEEKIKKLLVLTQEKGLVFALRVARAMNDPYLLDVLHDILSREGLYKKFVR